MTNSQIGISSVRWIWQPIMGSHQHDWPYQPLWNPKDSPVDLDGAWCPPFIVDQYGDSLRLLADDGTGRLLGEPDAYTGWSSPASPCQ